MDLWLVLLLLIIIPWTSFLTLMFITLVGHVIKHEPNINKNILALILALSIMLVMLLGVLVYKVFEYNLFHLTLSILYK
jgi:uncharacterized membrane protein